MTEDTTQMNINGRFLGNLCNPCRRKLDDEIVIPTFKRLADEVFEWLKR